MEYDSRTCITVGELRAMGFTVDGVISDGAWIDRTKVYVDLGEFIPGNDNFDWVLKAVFEEPVEVIKFEFSLEC